MLPRSVDMLMCNLDGKEFKADDSVDASVQLIFIHFFLRAKIFPLPG